VREREREKERKRLLPCGEIVWTGVCEREEDQGVTERRMAGGREINAGREEEGGGGGYGRERERERARAK